MPRQLIAPTTAAAESAEFQVVRGFTSRGLAAKGLQGAEQIVIHRKFSDGTWLAVTDESAKLTATAWATKIEGTGVYKAVKPITASAVLVDID